MNNIDYNDFDKVWETLVDCEIATDEEIGLVTTINGKNIETLLDILYARTGCRNFEQYLDN